MRVSISVDPWGCIFAALMILLVPLRWLFAAVLAAAIHESFHILAISLVGNRILGIRIGLGGTVIETDVAGNVQELLCAMAGPAGSLLLLTLCHSFPELALCGGVQGLFNLLPVYPLDGGRALLCFLRMVFPKNAARIGKIAGRAVLTLLASLALYGVLRLSLGISPVILLMLLLIKAFLRKKPCKQRQIRVQ